MEQEKLSMFVYKNGTMNTYRTENVSITLIINKDQSSAAGVREDFTNTRHVPMLHDKLPVFNVKVVDASILKNMHEQTFNTN